MSPIVWTGGGGTKLTDLANPKARVVLWVTIIAEAVAFLTTLAAIAFMFSFMEGL